MTFIFVETFINLQKAFDTMNHDILLGKLGYYCILGLAKNTTKNTVILPNFLVWKFCGKTHFSHSFARIYAETEPFYKISTQRS